MKLLMLSGDASAAQGRDGPFTQMLARFATHWDRIDILCPRAPGATARTLYGNVHVHPAPGHRLFQPRFIVRQGGELVRTHGHDLISSHDFGLFYNGRGALALARITGLPFVSEIHHVEGYPRAATWRERVYRWLARRYVRRVWRHAAAIRVVNAVEMPHLLRRWGVPDDKILVLPSLYLDFAHLQPAPGAAARHNVARYDVLFVGRMAPNKGLFTLLDAVAQVRQAHPAVTLAIRGDGPLRTALQRRIARLGLVDNVTWLPRVPDMAALAAIYRSGRMLVCASTSEGGPRVTVEAMACGVPVISTPVGIMSELVDPGVNGLLFEWDAAELAGHIRDLLADDDRRRRMGAAGHAAVQHFQADRVIAAYARGYHDLIHRLKES